MCGVWPTGSRCGVTMLRIQAHLNYCRSRSTLLQAACGDAWDACDDACCDASWHFSQHITSPYIPPSTLLGIIVIKCGSDHSHCVLIGIVWATISFTWNNWLQWSVEKVEGGAWLVWRWAWHLVAAGGRGTWYWALVVIYWSDSWIWWL